jgi:hypothetical protein
VSRNVAIGGGTLQTISAMSSSSITPGPLGISETKPSAEAPYFIASFASSIDDIQQIFTRIKIIASFFDVMKNSNLIYKSINDLFRIWHQNLKPPSSLAMAARFAARVMLLD